MSSGVGKEWGLISQCLSGFLAFFFCQNQMACKKKGLVGIHHKIQDSQQKVRTYPRGSRFAGQIPPNERNPFIACKFFFLGGTNHQTKAWSEWEPAWQHHVFFGYRGTYGCSPRKVWEFERYLCSHPFKQQKEVMRVAFNHSKQQGGVTGSMFLDVKQLFQDVYFSMSLTWLTWLTSCSPKTHEAQKRGAPPKVLNRQRKIIATVQFWKNISTNISCWCLSKIPSITMRCIHFLGFWQQHCMPVVSNAKMTGFVSLGHVDLLKWNSEWSFTNCSMKRQRTLHSTDAPGGSCCTVSIRNEKNLGLQPSRLLLTNHSPALERLCCCEWWNFLTFHREADLLSYLQIERCQIERSCSILQVEHEQEPLRSHEHFLFASALMSRRGGGRLDVSCSFWQTLFRNDLIVSPKLQLAARNTGPLHV